MAARFGWSAAALAIGLAGAAVIAGTSAGARAQGRTAVPTFTKDVAPILYKNCVACHRPGDIAPMSLMTYEEARPFASAIRKKVGEGSMPPWHAEAPAGTFLNDRRLSQADKDTLLAWASNGAPQGDPKDLPPAPTFTTGWSIGKPDVVLTMPTAFNVPAKGTIAYQYFQLPTNFTEDKWVEAIELRPGAPSVVHHILAFAVEPGNRPRPQAFTPKIILSAPQDTPEATAAAAAALAAPRGRGGQVGRGGRGGGGDGDGPGLGTLVATTAPGTNAQVFAPGRAILIRKGSTIAFQMHYTATGTPTTDRSSIGFVFAKQPVEQEVRTAAFTNVFLAIPPGAANHRVDSAIEFTADSHILALFPHTHLRGKRWQYRMVYPDGRSEVVLDVPRYDFNWQTYYEFAQPIAAPKGARLEAIAHYDNSTGNKSNPDATQVVRWGEQTWEEMQYTGITYTVDGAKPPSPTGQQ